MDFLKLHCIGCFNSFRQPDFHTYHKTLPLPPKTTVAGMIGSALGISPREVNDSWLSTSRFQMGIVGNSGGQASDLWQIRKYETKQIKKFRGGEEKTPYKTAVIVRELLYRSEFLIYLSFAQQDDYRLVRTAFLQPAWALSLGREDELVRIQSLQRVTLEAQEGLSYAHTVLPYDIHEVGYSLAAESLQTGRDLLTEAPQTVNLPIHFQHDVKGEVREADSFQYFTFVSGIAIIPNGQTGFYDAAEEISFQAF